MHANSMCISCLLSKQEKAVRSFPDEKKKFEYMHRLLEFLCEHAEKQCAPWLAARMDQIYEEFWGKGVDYGPIKHRFNQLMLTMEKDLERQIGGTSEPLLTCIKYVCAANYIDFGAFSEVSREKLEELLKKAADTTVSREEYDRFCRDLEGARHLVYLIDNCGEIVLDKIFIRRLKEQFPQLRITAVVRGEEVLNDATMEDAAEVGLTELVPCVGNGSNIPGTVPGELGPEASRLLGEADVIIAKGQGNFESLYGEGFNPYFLFLCKCELFVRRFGLQQFAPVFVREERIRMQDC